MGPVILARAGPALRAQGPRLGPLLHGHPGARALPALRARRRSTAANGILVGSGHIAARLRQAVDDPELNAKVRLGPPGVDTDLFAPLARRRARRAALGELAARAARAARGGARRQPGTATPAAAADAVEWFAEARGPRVIFVGKLIVSKGVDLLLAAWPLVHAAQPGRAPADRRLRRVPRRRCERSGDGLGARRPRRRCASSPRAGAALEGGEDGPLRDARAPSSTDPPAGYAERRPRRRPGSVRFAGRLEHDEVAVPVAASDALVFPSTFPEAFGMVAAEAAAAGRAAGLGRATRAPPRSAARSRPACPSDAREPGLVRARRRRGRRRSPSGSTPGSRSTDAEREAAARGAARDRRAALELGGRRPRRCSRPRRASSTSCRARRRLVTLDTSSRRPLDAVAAINRIAAR